MKRTTNKPVEKKSSLLKGVKSFTYSSSFRISANFCSVEHGLGVTVETDGTQADYLKKLAAAKIEIEKTLDELMPQEAAERMQKVQRIKSSFEQR